MPRRRAVRDKGSRTREKLLDKEMERPQSAKSGKGGGGAARAKAGAGKFSGGWTEKSYRNLSVKEADVCGGKGLEDVGNS